MIKMILVPVTSGTGSGFINKFLSYSVLNAMG